MRSTLRLGALGAGLAATVTLLLRAGGTPGVLLARLADILRDPAAVMDRRGPDQLVGTVVAGAGWVALLWLLCAVGLAVASGVPGTVGRLARRARNVVVPGAATRMLAAALGLGLVTGAGVVVAAPAATAGPDRPGPAADLHLPDLDWPTTAPRTTPGDGATGRPPTARHEPATDHDRATVVVRRGDTLWAIAAAHLDPGASDRRIAATWPAWWSANRAVIGADPDLLRPGQRLTAPTTPAGRAP